MTLLNDQGPVQAPNILIRGTYIELVVDSELIGNQKELLVDTVWEVPGSRQMLGVGLWGLTIYNSDIYSFIYCSAWLKQKLNTKIGLNTTTTHPPPQTFWPDPDRLEGWKLVYNLNKQNL